MEIFSITQLKKQCKLHGNYFFSIGNIKYFRTKYGENIYKEKYFITSEQKKYNSLRLYNVMKFNIVKSLADTAINIRKIQQFKSYNQAQRFIEKGL